MSKDRYDIRDVLVPVEHKKNTSDAAEAARCLAKYVYEVFNAQPTRSYVVGVTLCGTSMQLWKFDRSGAIGSEPLDIKENEENFNEFLSLIILFLTSNEQVLGFDPTFFDIDAETCNPPQKSMKIGRQSGPEELVIHRRIFRALGICGRGTTCWEAHLPGDVNQKFLVKDSWQPLDRTPEGDMLSEVTDKEVPHMARYYHHEDVHVDGMKVDIQSYVRQGLDFKAGVIVGKTSDHAKEPHNAFINRIHRRLILRDVGEPITNVDSPVRLLEALEGCIKGHQALLAAGFLHRDISTNNLMINNQAVPPAPKSFLIDLDLAIGYPIPTDQVHYTRTGTKVFMSVNLLAQVCEHDFADDLESFFWVLIWICIHYPANERKKSTVTNWSQMNPESLKQSKRDYLRHPDDLTKDFTSLYAKSDLINCVHEFAKIMGDPGVRGDQPATLYSTILKLLEKSRDKLSKRE